MQLLQHESRRNAVARSRGDGLAAAPDAEDLNQALIRLLPHRVDDVLRAISAHVFAAHSLSGARSGVEYGTVSLEP